MCVQEIARRLEPTTNLLHAHKRHDYRTWEIRKQQVMYDRKAHFFSRSSDADVQGTKVLQLNRPFRTAVPPPMQSMIATVHPVSHNRIEPIPCQWIKIETSRMPTSAPSPCKLPPYLSPVTNLPLC